MADSEVIVIISRERLRFPSFPIRPWEASAKNNWSSGAIDQRYAPTQQRNDRRRAVIRGVFPKSNGVDSCDIAPTGSETMQQMSLSALQIQCGSRMAEFFFYVQ